MRDPPCSTVSFPARHVGRDSGSSTDDRLDGPRCLARPPGRRVGDARGRPRLRDGGDRERCQPPAGNPGSCRPYLHERPSDRSRPDSAAADLRAISDDVADLSDLGREALTALVAGDVDRLSATIASGTRLAASIQSASTALRARLDALAGTGEGMETRIGSSLRVRYDSLVEALDPRPSILDRRGRPSPRAASRRSIWPTAWRSTTPRSPQRGRSVEGSLHEGNRPARPGRQGPGDLAPPPRQAVEVDRRHDPDHWIERNTVYDAALRKTGRCLTSRRARSTRRSRPRSTRRAWHRLRCRPTAGRSRDHGGGRPRRVEPGGHRDRGGARSSGRCGDCPRRGIVPLHGALAARPAHSTTRRNQLDGDA